MKFSQFFIFGLSAILMLSGCASLFNSSDSGSAETPVMKKSIANQNQTKKTSDDNPMRKRLMILPFLDEDTTRPASIRDEARTEVVRDLNKNGDIIVIDSRELKADVSTMLKDGEYKMADIIKAADGLGVAAVLQGKLIDLKVRRKGDTVGLFRTLKTEFEAKAKVKIVSVRSGKEIFNTVKTVTLEDANVRVAENASTDKFLQNNPQLLENLVVETFLDFAPQINEALSKMTWEGRIAMLSGDRVFLNVGKVSGLNMGDILKVSEEGEEIYDPQTGNYIGRVPGRLKGTLEVVSYFGQDGAIAVIHSGAGFRENDRVELY